MTTINVYLTFKGNCADAFDYYKSVFGGEFDYIGKFGEMPPQAGMPIPDSEKDKIMHVSLPISEETKLMGSDGSEAFGQHIEIGNNFSVSINVDSREKADEFFEKLAQGGVNMPIGDTFWGSYFGMCTDQFGINWQINGPTKA